MADTIGRSRKDLRAQGCGTHIRTMSIALPLRLRHRINRYHGAQGYRPGSARVPVHYERASEKKPFGRPPSATAGNWIALEPGKPFMENSPVPR